MIGKKMDRKLLSKEVHETKYIKKLAQNIYDKTTGIESTKVFSIKAGTARRIAKFILGKR
jgi:hypothetical protein